MTTPPTTPRRILLVCIGNRVRSPLAQGFLRAELDSAGLNHVLVDSAGTNVWPGDEAPEREAIFEAARAGIPIEHLRSRELTAGDFDSHDQVLAMDWDSHALAEAMAPAEHRATRSATWPSLPGARRSPPSPTRLPPATTAPWPAFRTPAKAGW